MSRQTHTHRQTDRQAQRHTVTEKQRFFKRTPCLPDLKKLKVYAEHQEDEENEEEEEKDDFLYVDE